MHEVVIIGAHTAVGRSITECLTEREVNARVRQATLTEHVGPGLELIDEGLLRDGDLFVVAMSGTMADGLVAGLARLKKPVLDVRGEDGPEVGPLIWPGLDPDAAAEIDPETPARIAVGLAAPILAVMKACAHLELEHVSVTTYESAARHGQAGMDELAAQTRGVFTMQTEDAKVFPASMAFDVVPALGQGADGDAGAADETLQEDVEAGFAALGGYQAPVLVTRALVPSFSAEAAMVELTLRAPVDLDLVEDALRLGRTLRWSDTDLMPSLDAVGREDVLVGRLRARDRRVQIWLTSDRLRRGSATQVALAVERWLDGQDVKAGPGGATT